ncbi:A/G-specific adenine glycosylase [Acutalibacter caecimuris]|uniref:A/G-specific adenine glycosylase n=1 Tax=Acutalibacter caecimuris TaxID=3093657 RepID=UPI002AC94696|nr:A/G-specific adenine glycosylase [Acutalibacter sp. M00118]
MTPLAYLPAPLLDWYAQNARTLPWRSDPTPYHVLVSELMLQQTRVAAVLGYYARFMDALPTVEDLAACPEDRLMKLWQGLGYYNRARNLRKAAGQIVEEFGGRFPADIKALQNLAGVGAYTAGAIGSIALGMAVPAVDGNVLRVVSRLTNDHRPVTKPAVKREITQAVAAVIPPNAPGAFNQAIMDLGAMVCLPGSTPLCDCCPAESFCAARQAGTAHQLPVLPEKKPRPVEMRTVYLIFHQGQVALRQRPAKGLLAGLWEFPNELAPWPCPVKGPKRDAGHAKHIFTHVEWRMSAYVVDAESAILPTGWRWAQDLDDYPIPSAFAGFTGLVKVGLASISPEHTTR